MIRESELIAQFSYLERQVLLTWIEEELSRRPRRGGLSVRSGR